MPQQRTLLVAISIVAAFGCESPISTDLSTGEEPGSPLAMRAPMISRLDLRSDTVVSLEVPIGGAQMSEIPDDDTRPLQEIFNPDTRVGFEDGYALSMGIQQYIGNIGRVETTAQVAFEDGHLGDHTAERQDYTPFLVDWGFVKTIWVQAKVFTDKKCGLSVQGSSKHEALWQFFQGRSAPIWGVTRRSSQAAPIRQAACRPATATGGGTVTQADGAVCHYLITYDIDTGEIVSSQFLYCTTPSSMVL